MGEKRQVFISYSHEDDDWCSALAKYLVGQLRERIEVWIDRNRIRAGASWAPAIANALEQADVAILLVSSSFLASDFITDFELPQLRERNKRGLEVIPVRIDPCSLETKDWLKSLEYRPRGEKTLAELGNGKPGAIAVKRAFRDLMNEIIKILDDLDRRVPPRGGAGRTGEGLGRQYGAAAARALLVDTLLQEVAAGERAPLAEHIVAALAKLGGFDGEPLFNATRLFIEYCLLHPEMPTSAAALRAMIDRLDDNGIDRALFAACGMDPGSCDIGTGVTEVNSRFFMLARQREAAWERYFEALDRLQHKAEGGAAPATLLRIRAHGEPGFIAAQFLVAGLLSHFDDDWGPVLNAYQHSIPHPAQRAGWFESLQASQWNCWLVWGPSVPICRCAQWQGRFAYQYGYGDENNSLPLIEVETDGDGRPLKLDPEVASLAGEGRAARQLRLSGRLRWGPHFLSSRQPAKDRYAFAAVQETLCLGRGPAHAHHSDGLVLQLERLEQATEDIAEDGRAYFSAYLWMMFLVAVAADDAVEPGAGPQLLRGKHYPPWPKHPADRIRVREARLWEDLLPVFVHANIADPAALSFQRRMLADNALALLRRVWDRRDECFDNNDVARGIRFHLACSSDYPGCGCALRYPSHEPLLELLRESLRRHGRQAKPDRDFAAAVVLPDADEDPARPRGLARYFSSCHLPELVDDYFEYISQIEHEKVKRQPVRRH